MSDQETEHDGVSATPDGASNHHQGSAITTTTRTTPTHHCSACGSSLKRRSPSSSSLLEEPSTKKKLSSGKPQAHHQNLDSFTRIPLPITFRLRPTTHSRRRPSNSLGPTSNAAGHLLNPQSPENVKNLSPASSSGAGNQRFHGFTKVPLPVISFLNPQHQSPENVQINSPPLHDAPLFLNRTMSDPTSWGTTTPPPTPTDFIRGSGSASKRLNQMKEVIRIVSQCCEEAMREEEEEEEGSASQGNNNNPKVFQNGETDDEAVSVERSGECLIIGFKCPCAKDFHILLSGSNCYYKLA